MGWTCEDSKKVKIVIGGEEITGREIAQRSCMAGREGLLEHDVPALTLAGKMLGVAKGHSLQQIWDAERIVSAVISILSTRAIEKTILGDDPKGDAEIILPGV